MNKKNFLTGFEGDQPDDYREFVLTGPRSSLGMIFGSLCFLAVLVFELFGSATYGHDVYVYFVAIEEGMEMIGVSFFLMATLIESHFDSSSKDAMLSE